MEGEMKNIRRLSILILVPLIIALGAGNVLGAGNYPEKPITLIVQSSAGGGSDIFARTLASAIQKEKLLPQPIVVENKPGGSGGIAYAYVAGKKKDPYYILTATPSFLTTPLQGKTPVGLKDFTPIANFAFDEFMLMVGQNAKLKSLNEIVAFAKANPKQITIGGTQFGGSDSLAIYQFEKAAGVQFNYIVFNSGGEVNAALLGGHVDMASTNPGEALELYKAGKVKILGVLSEKRLANAPEIPTMKEQGINAFFVQNRGIAAPADIPTDARKILEDAFFKYTKTEAYKKYCADNMLTEAWMDGTNFGNFLDEWNGKYAAILKDMGVIKKK
ncbi:MAG: tripartite tricarboxylate transporter substrate binding protein [Syntrophus sp. (in: bacteria)]|nr:tripartite tricarboxylate transporter substrate binding protein [Syntrophus sp. (in: bacteria)]